jgi:hypothetical protein
MIKPEGPWWSARWLATSPKSRAIAERCALVGALLGALCAVQPALAAAPHAFVVLREHATGTASRAQPYLDQLLEVVAEQNHWPKVTGRYFSERAPALDFVRQEKPEYGIVSLAAFLALKQSLSLSVIGEVIAPKAGGRQYFLVSKQAGAAGVCKGRRVSTTFGSDPKFIDRVVAGGAFRLADFTVTPARRPLEPLKQVLRAEVDCALIDDAQLESAQHIEQGAELKVVWRSAELPGMAVVAFPRAELAVTRGFKQSLGGLCAKAKQACASVGIERIDASDESRYRAALDAHAK